MCTLHTSTAEMYMVSGRVSGTIEGKGVSFASDTSNGYGLAYPPPPSMPAFSKLHASPSCLHNLNVKVNSRLEKTLYDDSHKEGLAFRSSLRSPQ